MPQRGSGQCVFVRPSGAWRGGRILAVRPGGRHVAIYRRAMASAVAAWPAGWLIQSRASRVVVRNIHQDARRSGGGPALPGCGCAERPGASLAWLSMARCSATPRARSAGSGRGAALDPVADHAADDQCRLVPARPAWAESSWSAYCRSRRSARVMRKAIASQAEPPEHHAHAGPGRDDRRNARSCRPTRGQRPPGS